MATRNRTAASSSSPGVADSARALPPFDVIAGFALGCVIVGWFFMNTLVVTLGSIQHGIRFFDMGAVIADPMRLFFGVDAAYERIAFGSLSLVCVIVTVVAHRLRRHGWIAYLAPAVLMLVSAALLYARISNEFYLVPSDAGAVGGGVVHFASHLIRNGRDLAARHITIAAGGYVAGLGCAVLTILAFRRRPI